MSVFSKIAKAPKRTLAAVFALAAFVALPIHSVMAADVLIEGSMGVANQTTGETQYKESTNAKYDEVVKFQVFYHNRELPNSGRVAEDFKIKIDMPTQAGKSQTVKVTMGGSNTNTVTDTATVNLDRADAKLEYIPGSAYWKHNVGTRENIQMKTENIADSIILNGTKIENVKPCHEWEATVTFMARVKVPAVSIDKFVRVKGQTNWTTTNTAKPGDTLEYQLAYKNTGNTVHNDVLIRDNLPPKMQYVAGSTKLKNSAGTKSVADGVTTTGIVVGDYNPGAAAYVLFEAKVPAADQLACGRTEFRNVGVARPKGMNEFYNTAITNVDKECANAPTYKCDSLTITKKAGRQITVANLKYTVTGGATFKNVSYDWGDGSTPMVTDKVSGVDHTYEKDGEYNIVATVSFNVNGQVKTATCTAKVIYQNGTPVTPVTPETPTVLPDTGVGSVLGLFAAISVAGAIAHRVVLARR